MSGHARNLRRRGAKELSLGGQRHLYVRVFRWGIYFQLRWRLRWFHLKLACWAQRGLRLSTRRQREDFERGKNQLPDRFASFRRFQVTSWTSVKGAQHRGRAFGVGWWATKRCYAGHSAAPGVTPARGEDNEP